MMCGRLRKPCHVFAQLGDKVNAINHATAALVAAPTNQKENLQTLISQIQYQLLPTASTDVHFPSRNFRAHKHPGNPTVPKNQF
jgi:hypothetical protein